jgi:hypothetical protein
VDIGRRVEVGLLLLPPALARVHAALRLPGNPSGVASLRSAGALR